MNKKMIRNFIIILVVLAALIGGIVLLKNIDAPQTTPAPTQKPSFTAYKVETSDIASFTIRSGEHALDVVKTDDVKWTINGTLYEEMDPTKIESLVTTVNTVVSSYEVDKNVQDLATYGLDNPYIKVSVTKIDGSVDNLLIGSKSPTLGEYFFLKQGETTVYTINSYKVDTLLNPLSYYQSFNRFSVKQEDVTGIEMYRRDKDTLKLNMRKNLDEKAYNIVWEVTNPYEQALNGIDQFIDESIILKLTQLTISEPAPSGKKYGFDNPSATLVVTSEAYQADGTRSAPITTKLVIGNTENGSTYVELAGKAYTVPSASLEFVYTDSFLTVSKLAAMVDITKASKVTVAGGGNSTQIEIGHQADDIFTFKVNGSDAEEKLSKQAYQAIIGMVADAMYENETLGTTDVTVTFDGYNGSENVTLQFIGINELNYAIRRNGNIQFVIRKSKVQDMLTAVQTYANNPQGK